MHRYVRDRATFSSSKEERELFEHGYLDERRTSRREWFNASRERRTVFKSQEVDKNSAFQAKGNRRKIKRSQLFKFKEGDHIGFNRPYVIWHHAIVSEVDQINKRLRVIHYNKQSGEIKVVEEWINLEDQLDSIYIFDYADEDPPSVVLRRARGLLGSKGYRFIGNNCEHFASFCKTGNSDCYQERWMWGKVKETLNNAHVLNVGKVVTAEVAESLTTDANVIGAAGVAVFETVHCARDIYRLNKARKCGEMSERDFRVSTTQRMVEGVFGGGCAIVGGLCGGPVTSIVLGGVGAFIGKFVGSAIGKWFGEWLW